MSTSGRTDWKEVIRAVKNELEVFTAEGYKPTLRAMFYRLYSKGIIPNTKSAYETLSKTSVKARWSYVEQSYRVNLKEIPLPPDCFVDNSREVIGSFNEVYLTPEQLVDGRIERLVRSQFEYKDLIPLWHNQPEYVEVWIEKDAMASTLKSILRGYDVRIVPNKGFSSMTFLYENVKRLLDIIYDEGKHVHILYYGDFDPSGDYMDTDLSSRLERFGLDFERYHSTFERVAVTREQIEEYDLPYNPDEATAAKMDDDIHTDDFVKKYGELYAVELDAMPALIPDIFKQDLVIDKVDQYYDEDIYQELVNKYPPEQIYKLMKSKFKRLATSF